MSVMSVRASVSIATLAAMVAGGQLNGRSRTVIYVPPGRLRLYAIPEKPPDWGDRIDGEVYLAFRALNPQSRDNRWANRETYMANAPAVEMDGRKVPEAVRLRKVDAHGGAVRRPADCR